MANRYFRRECPDPQHLAHVRSFAADPYPRYALQAALEAAKKRGMYIIE
jgi:hypothetical protein